MCERDTESFYLNANNPNFVFPANKNCLFVPKSNFISCNNNGFFVLCQLLLVHLATSIQTHFKSICKMKLPVRKRLLKATHSPLQSKQLCLFNFFLM